MPTEALVDLVNQITFVTFTCAAGHRLDAVAAGPHVAWICDCGAASIDPAVFEFALRALAMGFLPPAAARAPQP